MILQSRFEHAIKLGSKKLVDGPRTLSYDHLKTRCFQLNAFFKKLELHPGDRIAIASSDEMEVCSFILCCFRLGFPLAIIEAGSKKSEATAIIKKLDLKAIFIDQELTESWLQPEKLVPLVVPIEKQKKKLMDRLLGKKTPDEQKLLSSYPECLATLNFDEMLPHERPEDQTGLFLCTSGTTGLPKILQLSYANLFAAATTTSNQLGFDNNARVLNLLPLTHYDGVISGLFTTFWNTATIIRIGPFTVSLLPDILDAIYKYRATHLLLTPSILTLLLRVGEDLGEAFHSEDFRFVISVAASLLPQVWSDFERKTGKPIVNVYGLSETGNNLFAGPDDESYRIGSIGKPVDCNAMIVNDEGKQVTSGHPGELLLQGASITSGYLGEAITIAKVNGSDWFATGDIAYCDSDGVYWLAGRKKNIIIVGGRNVYPDEVNNALLQHASVVEAATFALPDEIWEERVVSCVVVQDSVTSQELMEHAAKRLTDYKVPREIHLVPQLPKGRSGKILVNELQQQLWEGSLKKKEQTTEKIEEQILRLASESFRVPLAELSAATTPQNCGRWDSVGHMDLVVNIETKFGIELAPREVIQIASLEAAFRIVREKLAT